MSYTNDQYEGMGGSYVVDRKGNRQPAQAGDEPAESAAQPQDKPDDAVVTASPDL